MGTFLKLNVLSVLNLSLKDKLLPSLSALQSTGGVERPGNSNDGNNPSLEQSFGWDSGRISRGQHPRASLPDKSLEPQVL